VRMVVLEVAMVVVALVVGWWWKCSSQYW
jgi:hypothetical protein